MKKFYAFCDLPLAIASAVLLVIMNGLCITGIVGAPSYALASDVFAIQCMWAVLMIGLWIGMVLLSKEVLAFVIFDSQCITFWVPFKGRQTTEYRLYSHVYPASYYHGSPFCLGSRMSYIVFSQKYLSDKVLTNINQLTSTAQTFKIRLRRKRYEELLKLLPPYQASMLQRAIKK